jgi:hypothetical protein
VAAQDVKEGFAQIAAYRAAVNERALAEKP